MFFFLSLFLSLPSFLLSQYHPISAPFLVCCTSPSSPPFHSQMYPHKPWFPIIIVLLLHPLSCITRQACDCLWVRLWRCSMASYTAYSTGFLQWPGKRRRGDPGFAVDWNHTGLPGGLGLGTTKLHSGAERIDFFQSESEGAGSLVDAATRCVLKLKLTYLIGTFRLSNDLLWMTSSFHSFHTAVWLSPDHALAWAQPKPQWAQGG